VKRNKGDLFDDMFGDLPPLVEIAIGLVVIVYTLALIIL